MKTKGRRQSENIRDARGKHYFKLDPAPPMMPRVDKDRRALAEEIEKTLGIGDEKKNRLKQKYPAGEGLWLKSKDKTQVTPGKWKTKSK